MFGYIKQRLEDEIDQEMLKLEKECAKRDEIKQDLLNINGYELLLVQIQQKKTSIITYTALTVLFGLAGVFIFKLMYIPAVIAGIHSFKLDNQLVKKLKKKEHPKYKEYRNMTCEELDNTRYEVLNNYISISNKVREIEENISNHEVILKRLQNYEEEHDYFNTGYSCIMTADTYEEALNLTGQYKKCMECTIEDFLAEKIDYSTIHFDNNIETDKKLVKKM